MDMKDIDIRILSLNKLVTIGNRNEEKVKMKRREN